MADAFTNERIGDIADHAISMSVGRSIARDAMLGPQAAEVVPAGIGPIGSPA